jgi:hypothetical protein
MKAFVYKPITVWARVGVYCALSLFSATNAATASEFSTKPDALLQVDLNRASIVDKIVENWKGEIPAAQISSFRGKLAGLRADQLLAANISGNFDGVLEIIERRDHSGALLAASPGPTSALAGAGGKALDHSKATGEADRDLIYTPVAPCRILDTRSASGAGITNPLQGNTLYTIKSFANTFSSYGGSSSNCGIPTTGEVKAIAVSINLLQQPGLPNFSAYLSISENNVLSAVLSNAVLNFNGGQAATASSIIRTTASGNLYMAMPAGLLANFVIEATGYFMPPSRIGPGLRVTGPVDNPIVVNGNANNSATAASATIAGGGAPGTNCDNYNGSSGTTTRSCANIVSTQYSTIGGGFNNLIALGNTFGNSTIAGGVGSSIESQNSTIGGGFQNHIDTGSASSTIAGGLQNNIGLTKDAGNATIGGGYLNRANGIGSTVPGGQQNDASGNFSFAAGLKASARQPGQFVWADAIDKVFDPQALGSFGGNNANTFQARATGGIQFISGVNAAGAVTQSCYMLPSTAGWTCSSDRNVKEAFSAISPKTVLAKLMKIPVSTWSYIGSKNRQMGPMAQDFYAAFGLSGTDKAINNIDAQGVAFAAIQGLNQVITAESKAKDAKIASLERELVAIKKKLGL